jgi:SAM-dependent methyltransferase
MSVATFLVGDVFDRMSELEDDSVDLILTSPPFLALRSYLPADHPDKHKEIGSEATPAEYIDVLLRLTAEWRRLLAPHGSLVVELGDTYSGAKGYGQPEDAIYGERHERLWEEAKPPRRFKKDNDGWPLAKSLTLIPESYRFALAYGINPHTGQPSPAGQWRIRNVVRWVRPNPPVGALGDKFRPATSELVVACVSKDRYFDLDAVREPFAEKTLTVSEGLQPSAKNSESPSMHHQMERHLNHAGAPPLDWWKISPQGYSGAHYAVWPSELCVKPIKAMCPRQVCRTCGEPRRRITETTNAVGVGFPKSQHPDHVRGLPSTTFAPKVSERVTLGWSDCGHDDYRPGLVLDPFAGTGTTLAVAHGHGRDAIGIDIDSRSAELARDRVGPLFLVVQEVLR